MSSELECAVCYRVYTEVGGRRCPRQLHCRHAFCHSCLRTMSRPAAPDQLPRGDTVIVCPLCRHTTSISGELQVAESVLELLRERGLQDDGDGDDETLAAEKGDSSSGSRGRKLRRCLTKVWRVMCGFSEQPADVDVCLSNVDMRNFAMMSSYMF